MSSSVPRDATKIGRVSDQSARISVCVDISVPRRSLLPMRGKNPGAYGVRVLPTQELPRRILFCKRLSRGQVPVSFDLPTKFGEKLSVIVRLNSFALRPCAIGFAIGWMPNGPTSSNLAQPMRVLIAESNVSQPVRELAGPHRLLTCYRIQTSDAAISCGRQQVRVSFSKMSSNPKHTKKEKNRCR